MLYCLFAHSQFLLLSPIPFFCLNTNVMANFLDKVLTYEVRKEILHDLFSFFYVEEEGSEPVLHDSEGDEFYGYTRNNKYDFETLRGIIEYAQDESRYWGCVEGKGKITNGIKKLLDIES